MKIKVTPKDGLRVLDPATKKPLPAEGLQVEASSYWRRRARDGEVEITNPAAKDVKSKAAKPKED